MSASDEGVEVVVSYGRQRVTMFFPFPEVDSAEDLEPSRWATGARIVGELARELVALGLLGPAEGAVCELEPGEG